MAEYTPEELEWKKRYDAVANRVMELAKEKEALEKKSGELSAKDKARLEKLALDMEAASAQVQKVLSQLEAARVEQKKADRWTPDAVLEMQSALADFEPGTVMLHYFQTEDKLHIIVSTARAQAPRAYEIKPEELNKKVFAFKEALKDPWAKSDPLPLAKELYKIVLGPVAKDLEQAEAKTLMVSLDGTLRYVPLGALHDGKKFVIERWRTAVFTGKGQHTMLTVPTNDWHVAAMGSTRGTPELAPLANVTKELQGIVRQEPTAAQGVLPGSIRLDDQFTLESLKQALSKEAPQVAHIATHFVFRPGTVDASYLLLGDGKQLALGALKRNDIEFRGLDLLTLSACETAVTEDQRGTGREMEGLAMLAQTKGAKGVLATLWPVADESTSVFMQEFYRLRQVQKLSKAEALRQVQLKLLKGELKPSEPIPEDYPRSWAHPFFWAPFVLIGNWL